jgi:4-hydroxybenzoate polyprenyltransferase
MCFIPPSNVPNGGGTQDKVDDVHAGVKSTALLFGDHTRAVLSGFATLSTASLLVCGATSGAGLPFYGGVAAVAAHYTWQLSTVDLDDRADCMAKFVSNKWLGLSMTGAIVADKLTAMPALL